MTYKPWTKQVNGTEWTETTNGKYKVTRLADGQYVAQRRKSEGESGALWVSLKDEAGKDREFDNLPDAEIALLLHEWSNRSASPGLQMVGTVQQGISRDLEILEELRNSGCSRIPGEGFDVSYMIQDRQRLMREMLERLSQL